SVQEETLATTELNLYVSNHFVVTVHRRPLPLLMEVMTRCERGGMHASRGADWLTHSVIDALVDQVLPVVERMDEDIAMLEDGALQKPGQQLVERISNVKRSTMRLRWLVAPQREVINRVARGDFEQLIRPETSMYFRDVYDHLVRLDSMVEDLRDLGETVMSIYLATQNNRLNEIMKALGIVGVLFLPLTLVASVFGTNFDQTYMASGWLGFGLMCASFLATAGFTLWLFKKREWI
ncbi:MAG: magnesium transporter CorA family protein, partial [Chloroflexota bacterium]|nr:magnesium transporter CorA family protein [Chloroflexota bacterium]